MDQQPKQSTGSTPTSTSGIKKPSGIPSATGISRLPTTGKYKYT